MLVRQDVVWVIFKTRKINALLAFQHVKLSVLKDIIIPALIVYKIYFYLEVNKIKSYKLNFYSNSYFYNSY